MCCPVNYCWRPLETLDEFAALIDTEETAAYERFHPEICRQLQTLVMNQQLALDPNRYILVLPSQRESHVDLFLVVATLEQVKQTRLFPNAKIEEARDTRRQRGDEFTQALLTYHDQVAVVNLMLPFP